MKAYFIGTLYNCPSEDCHIPLEKVGFFFYPPPPPPPKKKKKKKSTGIFLISPQEHMLLVLIRSVSDPLKAKSTLNNVKISDDFIESIHEWHVICNPAQPPITSLS